MQSEVTGMSSTQSILIQTLRLNAQKAMRIKDKLRVVFEKYRVQTSSVVLGR